MLRVMRADPLSPPSHCLRMRVFMRAFMPLGPPLHMCPVYQGGALPRALPMPWDALTEEDHAGPAPSALRPPCIHFPANSQVSMLTCTCCRWARGPGPTPWTWAACLAWPLPWPPSWRMQTQAKPGPSSPRVGYTPSMRARTVQPAAPV